MIFGFEHSKNNEIVILYLCEISGIREDCDVVLHQRKYMFYALIVWALIEAN